MPSDWIVTTTSSFTDLLKGQTRKSTKPIVWNAILDLAFKQLKDLVCKDPSLLLPDPSKPFEVETDASDYAIGVVLYQDGKPIAFESKKLDSAQNMAPLSLWKSFCGNYGPRVLEIFL